MLQKDFILKLSMATCLLILPTACLATEQVAEVLEPTIRPMYEAHFPCMPEKEVYREMVQQIGANCNLYGLHGRIYMSKNYHSLCEDGIRVTTFYQCLSGEEIEDVYDSSNANANKLRKRSK